MSRIGLKFDYLIIGAGVIGLSIGIALLRRQPNLKIIVVEKEKTVGQHASGRNSGVLHAGFYYSPDTLKARFCREGNELLKQLAKKYSIKVDEVGKVVVSRNSEEDARLDDLYMRGTLNGVELELLDVSKLEKYEPLARTFSRFLWSPNTAIADSNSILTAFTQEFLGLGGKICLNSQVHLVERGGEIHELSGNWVASHYINAAGAQADRIARKVGVGLEYAMVPFMGIYRVAEQSELPLRTLVYPVPHPINPFLGIHLTLSTNKKIKIGPTAIPVLGREQYSMLSGWSISDLMQTVKGARSIQKHKVHDLKYLINSEFRNIFETNLVDQAAQLVPNVSKVRHWNRLRPGIRAQLVHTPSGSLEQDFKVINHLNSTHILNAVSPGWTSSLSFGQWVAQQC